MKGALTSFQKVTEWGDQGEDFVKDARELLCDMEASVSRDTGLSLTLYIQSMEEFDRSFSCMQNRKYKEAIVGFNNVLKLNNNHAQSYGNLGLCYSFLGMRQEALSAFDKALEIDPKYKPAIDNKKIFLSLKVGERMPDSQVEVVEYYKEIPESVKPRVEPLLSMPGGSIFSFDGAESPSVCRVSRLYRRLVH